jgi:hypothetical protein
VVKDGALLLLVDLRDNEFEVALTHVTERKHGREHSSGQSWTDVLQIMT